jgi:ubiquinone/menaquinone biosynthesis C-methylase UbiE
MLGLSGLPPGSRLMDVGCGDGSTVRFLQKLGYDIIGIDVAISMDDEPHELPIRHGTASKLPCRDSELDGILCECVLSLLDSPRTSLMEFRRALSHRGALMISDIYFRRHVRPLNEINNLIRGCGFSIEHCEDCSDALVNMAAQMIMDIGSQGMREKYCIDYDEMKYLGSGYFFLVARANERAG